MNNNIENIEANNVTSKKSKKKRIITLILTILLNLGIVGFIAGKELINNHKSGENKFNFEGIDVLFLVLGLACFGVALFAEFMKYRKMLMLAGGKKDNRGAFEVATYGKYADNVTPFGAGGQPFQIHYLHKRGYTSGTAAAVTIAGFLTQQIAFILIAIFVLIFNPGLLTSLAVIKVAAFVGLVFYSLIPLAILFFVVLPKPFGIFIKGILKLLEKIHIIKNAEKKANDFFRVLDEYVNIIKKMIKRPIFLLKVFFWSLVYQMAILSAPFFSMLAFKGSIDWWNAFSMTVYIYLAITIIPTPGNSGVAEGSFYIVFSSLEGGALFWAMILWRALVYYSWIIIGLFVVMRTAIVNTLKVKKEVPSDRPLKIALACDTYYPNVDGVVRTIHQYAKDMTKLGHKVVVICPKINGYDDSNLPYEVYRLNKFKVPFIPFDSCKFFLNRKDRKYFKEIGFDVIHTHSPFTVGRIMERFGRRNKIPTISTFHSKYYDDVLHLLHSKLIAKIVVSSIVNFYCRIDSVWACSASTSETLRSYGFNGPITVMENGVEHKPAEDLSVYKEEVHKKFNLPYDKRILLFVGQQIWHKNIKLILDTLKELPNEYICCIAGTGYDEEEIKKYSKDIEVDSRVFFVGRISDRGTLFGLYSASDLFFFPSIYDNAPLVVREAALAALPSLLVEGSNAGEIINDGVNGYLAKNDIQDMKNKIIEIFNKGDIKEVGLEASKTIPIFWSDIIQKVINTYISEFKK